MNRPVVLFIASAVCWIAIANAARADSMYFTSTPGSWIGQGQTLTVNTVSVSRYYSQGAFTNAVVLNAGGYSLTLVEPNFTLPATGYFANVTRWPFMGNGAGMDFTAPGRGDNMLSGWFNVLDANYSPIDGSVVSFAVDFKQFDESSTTVYTQGSFRYNSLVPVPEPRQGFLLSITLILVFSAAKARRKRMRCLPATCQ